MLSAQALFRASILSRAASNSQSAKKLRRRRMIFFGNDSFSLTQLQTLHQLMMAETNLVSSLCVTTSSKRTPVFRFANSHGMRTHLWADLDLSTVEQYDLGILASFGHLLPEWLLDQLPVVNVHPSLLPRWRGSAPVIHTILRGDALSGVSIMLLEPHRFDCGSILSQQRVVVPDGAKTVAFTGQLAEVGQRLLTGVLRNLPRAIARASPQTKDGARVARRITAKDAVLDWETLSAAQIDRLARSVGDIVPLTSRLWDLPVALRDFATPLEIEELRCAVTLPTHVEPGMAFFSKLRPDVVFVKCNGDCHEWTAFRAILIGRSSTTRRWLTALEFNNGYLSNRSGLRIHLQSARNPLFQKRTAFQPPSQLVVES